MRVGRILFPIRELGPGQRLGIWVQGCERRCEGCANPELWDKDDKKEIPLPVLQLMASSAFLGSSLDGITITGGEPMLQAKELYQLLVYLQDVCKDVLVFTGYRYENLLSMNDPDISAFLSLISVLVDGEYIKEQNIGARLRGSANQRIIFLDETKRADYEQYISSEHRHIDSFLGDKGVISVGIHPQQFLDELGAESSNS